MVKDHLVREETHCYQPTWAILFLLSARDSIYHDRYYTSCRALAGIRIAQGVHHINVSNHEWSYILLPHSDGILRAYCVV